MRKPEFITFTGLDDRTDLDAAIALSEKYPIEWGVLFSPSQQGKPGSPRFPSLTTLDRISMACRHLRLAAHLCGAHSRIVNQGVGDALPEIPAVITNVYRRVQINHVYAQPQRIARFQQAIDTPCIAQFTIGPFPSNESVQWLYDPSGGFGREPENWPRHPGGERLVGYAGGIGPANAAEVVRKIGSAGPFWIDMETRVRTEGNWLDLDLCRQVCVAVYG